MSYCHIHHYSPATKQCPECHQPICAACEQHGGTFDGKWVCPSCMKAYCDQVPQWKEDKTRNIIFLAVSVVLVISAIISAIVSDGYWGATFLCGLAGLPILAKVKGLGGIFKGAGKGNTAEDMIANGCLVIGLGVIIIFIFAAIVAPINIIILAVNIATLSKKISTAGAAAPGMTQYMSDAGAENQRGDIIAHQQAAERAREEQRQSQERADAQRAEVERQRQERAALAAARSAPREELCTLTLVDAGPSGPYRQNIIKELKKHTDFHLDTLSNGMELAAGIPVKKADEIEKALQALGARVERKRAFNSY